MTKIYNDDAKPLSALTIVAGLASPEFLVELEVMAGKG